MTDEKLDTADAVIEWAGEQAARWELGNRQTDTETAAYLAECVRLREAWHPCEHVFDHARVCVRCSEGRAMKGGEVRAFDSWKPGPEGDAARERERYYWYSPPRTKRDEENERLRVAFERNPAASVDELYRAMDGAPHGKGDP